MAHFSIAHSPDTDDVCMFWALKNKGLSCIHTFDFEAHEIQILNQLALAQKFDLTALSFGAYPAVADNYFITLSGASMADKGFGPLVVSKHALKIKSVKKYKIAVPGLNTTSALLLQMAWPNQNYIEMPFDQILSAVNENLVDAGLLIHESQILYKNLGLDVELRLQEFWLTLAPNLPLPLGCNVVKKSLGKTVSTELSHLQAQSIQFAMDHPQLVLTDLKKMQPHLDESQIKLYLSWYVNQRTLNLAEQEQQAIQVLLDLMFANRLLKKPLKAEYV